MTPSVALTLGERDGEMEKETEKERRSSGFVFAHMYLSCLGLARGGGERGHAFGQGGPDWGSTAGGWDLSFWGGEGFGVSFGDGVMGRRGGAGGFVLLVVVVAVVVVGGFGGRCVMITCCERISKRGRTRILSVPREFGMPVVCSSTLGRL